MTHTWPKERKEVEEMKRLLIAVVALGVGLLWSAGGRILAQNWFQTGQPADIILGPYVDSGGASALHHPSRVCTDTAGRLYVADTRNNRVLIWNTIPTTNYQPADIVVGQPDMHSNDSGGDSTGLNWPVGVYSDGIHLFVADANNRRVLIWDSIPTQNGEPANLVLGQPNFTSYELIIDSTLTWPWDVFYDGQHLYILDAHAAGVLIWNSLPTQNGQPEDWIMGGWSDSALIASPRGIASNGTALAINDYQLHRVLLWYNIPTQPNEPADVVLLQPDFTPYDEGHSTHGGISMHGDTLYVAVGHNIWVWTDIYTLTNGQDPDYIIGRSDRQPTTSAVALSGPWGVSTDGTRLYVGDTNNSRVLIYNQIPSGPDIPADVVLGQVDFGSNVFRSRRGIRSVGGVASTGHHLFLSSPIDNRIVVHDGLPEHDSASADYLLSNVDFDIPRPIEFPKEDEYECSQIWTDGSCLYATARRGILMWDSLPQSNLVREDRVIDSIGPGRLPLYDASGITSDGTRLFVSDTRNNRVIIWNTIPTENNTPADIVLGQPDFNSNEPGLMNSPSRIATDGTRLVVSGGNQRILIWNTIPTEINQPPDITLGEGGGYCGCWGFNLPAGVFIFDNHLFVNDLGNNRTFVWNTFPTTGDQLPDVILGQPDSLTKRARKARDGLHNVCSLWFDGDYLWIGEFKFADRVLGYRATISPTVPGTPSALTATTVSGHQINLSWVDNATNEQGFKVERKIGTDGTYKQIRYLSANTTSYRDKWLNSGIEYFYRIRAYNRYGDSDYSNETNATTSANNPPNIPSNPSPADGDTVADFAFGVKPSWTGGDPDEGDAVTYDIYFDTYDPPIFLLSANQVNTFCGLDSLRILSLGTNYYWKVVARDLEGAETEGPVWNFYTCPYSPYYNLTISTTAGGTTFPRPGTHRYRFEPDPIGVPLTAIPDSGYSFSGWTGDTTDTINPITIIMDSDKSVRANFTLPGVEEEHATVIPKIYKLFQNYPDPFNLETKIGYQLPNRAYVEITIYDITGRKVKKLVSAIKPAGHYSVVWDGRNSHGKEVSSGVYFYRLKAKGISQTRKMILLK